MTEAPRRFAEADVPTLRAIWLATLEQFTELAMTIPADQWDEPSLCPGWSVGDVVAHTLALESELHGDPLPDHEPDWAQLPHASDALSQYIERPIDWYRGLGQDVVLAELQEMTQWRRADFAQDATTDPDEEVLNFGGWRMPRARMIRTRILDIWIHDQDIRGALGNVGDLGTDGAWVTAEQLVRGLPFVWAKQVGAPVGSSVQLRVTGPGVEFIVQVVVDDAARGILTAEPVVEPTVRLTLPWPLYVHLSAGRIGALAEATGGQAQVDGDAHLATELLKRLVVTP